MADFVWGTTLASVLKRGEPCLLLSGLAFGQEPKSGWHRSLLDRDLNSLGNLWLPTNTDTTAYNSHPVVYPIIDSPALSALGSIAIEDRK